MFSIYCITNSKTDKKYVGYTKEPETRWYKHQWHGNKGEGTCIQLYKSMKKHGIENFSFKIIEENILSEEEAKTLEIKYIEKFNTYKNGYNATPGGTGGDMSNYETWNEAIKNYHETKPKEEYATYGMKGKKHSNNAIEKQSIARLSYWKNLNTNDRAERSKSITGSKNGMFGKSPKNSIHIMFNDIEYNSLAAASRATGHSIKFLKKHGEIYNDSV